jgi:hypothetical protein
LSAQPAPVIARSFEIVAEFDVHGEIVAINAAAG